MSRKTAVVLFNLGGPDSLKAVRPFLFNLFFDPAIIRVPTFFRRYIARFISARREHEAQDIYRKLGGKSPILENTVAQAEALQAKLRERGLDVRCIVSMRYWRPFSRDVIKQLKFDTIERIVLLPLYPQYSTTTTESSINNWFDTASALHFGKPTMVIDRYPTAPLFIKAHVDLIKRTAAEAGLPLDQARILFSAHGLPEKIVAAGDPYPKEVNATVAAVVEALGVPGLDAVVCYQSRVGPMKWIGPSTEDELKRAGADRKPVIVVPISFVSEHSETLVELDMDYRRLADNLGVPNYVRVPALATHDDFITALADEVDQALASQKI